MIGYISGVSSSHRNKEKSSCQCMSANIHF